MKRVPFADPAEAADGGNTTRRPSHSSRSTCESAAGQARSSAPTRSAAMWQPSACCGRGRGGRIDIAPDAPTGTLALAYKRMRQDQKEPSICIFYYGNSFSLA
eukprot:6191679-Pleurochrysis_carterae.AAC.1